MPTRSRINLGSGTHYAPGWLNLDVKNDDHTRCDLVVDGAHPFADIETNSVAQVYLGHVLEHLWWPRVHNLLVEVRRVLEPGGRVLATGPDIRRLLVEWHEGRESWELLTDALEHADLTDDGWPEATHKWNCHEARVVDALERAGFVEVTPTEAFDGWPVVAWSAWQCAVLGVKADA